MIGLISFVLCTGLNLCPLRRVSCVTSTLPSNRLSTHPEQRAMAEEPRVSAQELRLFNRVIVVTVTLIVGLMASVVYALHSTVGSGAGLWIIVAAAIVVGVLLFILVLCV